MSSERVPPKPHWLTSILLKTLAEGSDACLVLWLDNGAMVMGRAKSETAEGRKLEDDLHVAWTAMLESIKDQGDEGAVAAPMIWLFDVEVFMPGASPVSTPVLFIRSDSIRAATRW